MSISTATSRRGRTPIHPLRLLAIAALIALVGFAFLFATGGLGGVAIFAFALIYLAIAVGFIAIIAWGTLIGIRYYDHTMRDT